MLLQAEEVKEEEEEEEEEIIELTGKDLKKRVEHLSATLTVHVWRYMARGLFDTHKLIVASMLAFRHLSQPTKSKSICLFTEFVPDASKSARQRLKASRIIELPHPSRVDRTLRLQQVEGR